MSLAVCYSRAQLGITAPQVSIEVHLANGLPGLAIVGLPEAAVRESKDRVRGALQNCGFEFPAKRITINLAPADLPKEGSRFDLPIAIGILAASNQIPLARLQEYEFLGELGLGGELRPVNGVLPSAIAIKHQGRQLITSLQGAVEAARVEGLEVFAAEHLLQITAHLHGQQALPLQTYNTPQATEEYDDLSDIIGQYHAKQALKVAAAGGHALLMMGPPGTGKTMLARRLPGLLPLLSMDEALETAAVYSINGQPRDNWLTRPFRAPHHTASAVALVGGGSNPRPGEISLAHNGILFLDELPEFDRKVLEVLREPMESGHITISRAARQAEFPSRFQLVAAMNPCPCGYLGHPERACRCTPAQIERYQGRISGPLLDRIDMHIEVPYIPVQQRRNQGQVVSSEEYRAEVIAAQQRQITRQGCFNSRLEARQLKQFCVLEEADQTLLEQALTKLALSARAHHNILRLARTLADLEASEQIQQSHLLQALSFRKTRL